MSSEMQLDPEGQPSVDAESKNEIIPVSSESENETGAHETGPDVGDKKEPSLLERTELKSESEDTSGPNVPIKNEPDSFASVYVVEPETNIHEDDHEIDVKTEIKQEPECLETSAELIPSSEEIHLKDGDFDSQDNVSGGDQDFVLPESRRPNAEVMWNYEHGIASTDGNNYENTSTNTAFGGDFTNTYDMDGKIIHKCKYCGKCFTEESDLKSHLVIHESKRLHKCQLCERNFTSSTSLKTHYLIHQGKKPHKCEVCEKHFTTIADLKRHNLVHEGIRPYKCEHCEKSFTRASHLKTHNLIHEGKKPHKCNICEKSFTQMSHLKAHKFLHEGVSPFKCEICEKSFAIASHLKVHNLIHEGKRPHKCQICGKSFIMASHLKAHNLIHEGKKPHKCAICEKCFTTSSELKRHHLTHEAIKPYKCDYCERTFSTSGNLKAHLIYEGKKAQDHSILPYVAVHYLDPSNYVTET